MRIVDFLEKIPPPVKYGPPIGPSPSEFPVPKYGAPASPWPFQGHFDPGSLFSADHILPLLVALASLAIYAWIIFGWAVSGSLLYLQIKEKR